MGFNKIILEGRLTKDVEIRYTQSGMAMAKGNIAVSKKFTSNGEKKEKTLFVNLQFWQRSAEIFNQYCRKGSHLLIEGELENANWTDANGNKKYDFVINVSSMQMLDSKNGNSDNSNIPIHQENIPKDAGYAHNPQAQQTNQRAAQHAQEAKQPSMNQEVPIIDIDEDEIPF